MDYREQYDRYVAMIEETIEKILPQTETDCPERPSRFPGICVRRCVTACWRAANVCAGAAAGGMRYVGRRYQPGARACRGAGNDSYLFIDS